MRAMPSICSLGNTCPPVACFTCGSGLKPSGNSPRSRISSGLMRASDSQVTPGGSFTRTPACTGLRPPDIRTPGTARSERS